MLSLPLRLQRFLCLLALGVTGVFCSSSARAEPAGRIVVVPHATHELTPAEQRVADQVESALAGRTVRVVSMHEARDRVQALSRPPAVSDDSDLDVVAREARAAIEHAAFGRSAAAQRSVQAVINRAERALESLNRETKTARNVLDACLALVRDAITRGQRRDALAEAMRCRRLVPDVSPSELLHPATIIGVLAEADDQLRRLRMGRLSVISKPEAGCAVYVNGRHLGVTPFQLERAAAGEYRVQAECGRTAGRVHIVQLGSEPVALRVDAGFDRALRSADRVALVYEQEPEAELALVSHAAQLGRLVEAEEVLLLHVDGAMATLRRVGASEPKLLGRASFSWLRAESASSSELAQALELLLQGRFEPRRDPSAEFVANADELSAGARRDTTQPPQFALVDEPITEAALTLEGTRPPLASAPAPAPASAPTPVRKRRLRLTTALISAGGLGLLATGVGYEMVRARADAEIVRLSRAGDPNADAELDRYDRAASLRWIGVGGGVLLASAAPLLRLSTSPPHDGATWWSYALGAAGLGLGAWGVVELSRHGECTLYLDDGCYTMRETKGRGALLLSAAAPLLTVPLDRLIAAGFSPKEAAPVAYLSPGRGGLMLMVQRKLW